MAGLAELVRVAEKNKVTRHAGHRENIRKRHLARFVHDQVIQLRGKGRPSEQPGGSGDNVDVAVAQRHLDGRGAAGALYLRRGTPIAVVGLLHRPDGLAAELRLPHQLVEQVADDFVAVGGYPDPAAALHQLTADLGTDGRLSGSGWALDGEIGAIQARRKQHGDISRPLARLKERRSFDDTLDTRRLQAQEITGGPKLSSTAKAVIH